MTENENIETNPDKFKAIPDTLAEKIKNLLLRHLFAKELDDIKSNYFTKGVSDGYKLGRKHQKEQDQQIAKTIYNVDI